MKEVQIYFDEKYHRYTDNEGNLYTSVTQLIQQYENEYPEEFWAYYRVVDKQYGTRGIRPDVPARKIWCKTTFNDVGRWYSISEIAAGVLPLNERPSIVLSDWSTIASNACDRGNAEHNYLEDCINAMYPKEKQDVKVGVHELPSFSFKIDDIAMLNNSPLRGSHPSVFQTIKQLIEKGFVIYAEKRVYSYDHRISGTIDILAVDANGEFYIVDWKTNKDPLKWESGYFKKVWNADRTEKVKTNTWVSNDDRLKAPIDDLQDCKGSKYTIQLSLYARLCELWGLKCLGLILCHLRIEPLANGGVLKHEPEFYNITYIAEHVDRLLNLRIPKVVGQTTGASNKVFRKQLKY